MPGGGGVLPAIGGVLAAPVAPSRLDVAGGGAAGGGHDVRAANAAALPAGGADVTGADGAAPDTAVMVAGAAALTVVGLLAVTGDLLALCAAAGTVLAASVDVTPPAAAGEDSTGGGWVLRMTRAPSVSGIPAGASLTT